MEKKHKNLCNLFDTRIGALRTLKWRAEVTEKHLYALWGVDSHAGVRSTRVCDFWNVSKLRDSASKMVQILCVPLSSSSMMFLSPG